MVGSAIVRALRDRGFKNLLLRTHAELDLCEQVAVRDFFAKEKPDYLFVAAARVGGIIANSTYPVEFLAHNLLMEINLLSNAYSHGVKKTLFLGSSCIYPKLASQPIQESSLLTGPLEPTNEAYALAKICGIKLGEYYVKQYGGRFISAMPTNLYGPNDNFNLQTSHVVPALLRKFHEAKQSGSPTVTLWGTGTPLREFMHVDDLADACLFLMENYELPEFINIGSGQEVSIAQLAQTIQRIVGFEGKIVWDPTKPDGTPRKLMDGSRLRSLGWKPRIGLEEGLASAYRYWIENPA